MKNWRFTEPQQAVGAENESGQGGRMQYLPVVQEQARTINALLDEVCQRYRDMPALGFALEQPISYREMHAQVLALAARLSEDGLQAGGKAAILGESSPAWCLAYLAVLRLGASVVPIFPDLPEADVHHILGQTACELIFLTQRQIEKIYDLKQQIKQVISLDDYCDDTGLISAHPFSKYLQEAIQAQSRRQPPVIFPETQGEDLASILFTSGTSGFSKAVLLSHANLCANAYSARAVMRIAPQSVFLSILPISHTYEFTVGFLLPLLSGARIAYTGKAPNPAILEKICSREQPHIVLMVPLIIEKIFKKRIAPHLEKNKVFNFFYRFSLSRKLIHRKAGAQVRAFFGNRLQLLGIGGAALPPDIEVFLREAKIPFLVGYGMTEAAPLLSGGPHGDTAIPLGSAGKPVPGVELRIQAPHPESGIGEIEARGPNIMQSYLNDAEASKEAFSDDGWLKTGDLGLIDANGYLFIKGRSKSLIVLSNGENVYPEIIEHKLNAFPFVAESLVLENNKMIEAWIYPDYESVEAPGQTRMQQQERLARLFEQMRMQVNQELPPAARLHQILERPEPFIKTATHKIKRYLYTRSDGPGAKNETRR